MPNLSQATTPRSGGIGCLDLMNGTSQPAWYAAYTRANHEKHVAEQLIRRGIECYLPLYDSVRCWKDRRIRLSLPLLPGYLFVRIAFRDRLRVLEIPSVVSLVGFGRGPVSLDEAEVESLRSALTGGLSARPHPFLNTGHRVRVKQGPFEGLEGIIVRRKGEFRLVVSFSLIQRSIYVEVDSELLESLNAPARSSSRLSGIDNH